MDSPEQRNSKTPSIFSALTKINTLLTARNKIRVVMMACFALCVSLLELATASTVIIFGKILNNPSQGHAYIKKLSFDWPLSTNDILVMAACLFGLVYLIKNIVAGLEVFFQNYSIQKMGYSFKNKLLNKYAYADYAEYLTKNSSFNSRVVGGDAERIFSGAMVALALIFSEGIIFVCLVSFVIYVNPSFALSIIGCGIMIGILIIKFVLPHFYWWGKKSQDAAVMSWQNLLQFFHAFKEIVILGKKEAFIDQYKIYSLQQANLAAIQASVKALPRIIIETIFIAIFVFAIYVLVYSGQSSANIIGTLGGYLYAAFRLMPGLNRIIVQLNIFKGIIPSIERVHLEYNTVATPQNYEDIPEFSFTSKISIQNISYRYKGADTTTLENINFDINKGENIGIIGETGSGKSTLIDIILGLLQPSSGHVLIDHQFPVCSKQWHAHIGYVSQSLYLSDDTIKANIAFGYKPEQMNEKRLQQVIQDAQLQKLIEKLPEGINTIVGERGIRLSGGERQRIAIARALYNDPDILIFDEATSALDNKTEEKLMDTIADISKNRTVIMIAHRLSTLKNCDRIITLKDGRLESVKTSIEI